MLMDYLILISINSFQKVVSTPMPQNLGIWEKRGVFCKVLYKYIFYRLMRVNIKYRKLYISPLEFPLFSYYYSLVNRPATTN